MKDQLEEIRKYSVLFVDDEAMSLKYFARAYGRHFNVLTASDTEAAIDIMQQPTNNVAVLITDKQMPKKNGIELLQWAKREKPEVIRLLTTAYTELNDTISAINDGEIFRYVPKPWQIDRLLDDINSAMSLYIKQTQIRRRADDSSYSVTKIAGHIAHELRTPLINIYAIAKGISHQLPTLLKTYEAADPARKTHISATRLKALEQAPGNIVHSINQANSMIDTLLANVGKVEIDERDYCQFSAIAAVNNALTQLGLNKETLGKINVSTADDFLVYGSEHLFRHVIVNLINNALYAVNERGQGDISVWLNRDPQYNTLHIKDSGTGIPENVLPMIFDEYFTTKRSDKGTGLGLSFCKHVMRAHGGEISCTSKQWQFTEFMLRFPTTAPVPGDVDSKNKSAGTLH